MKIRTSLSKISKSAQRAKAALIVSLFVLGVVFAATGCGASDSDCKGDPGKVIEKDYDAWTKTTSADWDVTVLREDDTTYEKDLSSTAYDWYKVGGKFPHPTKCTADGKVK